MTGLASILSESSFIPMNCAMCFGFSEHFSEFTLRPITLMCVRMVDMSQIAWSLVGPHRNRSSLCDRVFMPLAIRGGRAGCKHLKHAHVARERLKGRTLNWNMCPLEGKPPKNNCALRHESMHHVGPLTWHSLVAAYLESNGRTEICTTVTFVTLQRSIVYNLGNIGLI